MPTAPTQCGSEKQEIHFPLPPDNEAACGRRSTALPWGIRAVKCSSSIARCHKAVRHGARPQQDPEHHGVGLAGAATAAASTAAGSPQSGLEQRPPDKGKTPAAAQEPHRARTRTHPFCYARKQDIPAIAFWYQRLRHTSQTVWRS